MDKFLRVDVQKGECRFTDIPPEYRELGGRGLTSALISGEVHPLCHPLGSSNKLVIAPGVLAGTTSPCSQRVSVGLKSPRMILSSVVFPAPLCPRSRKTSPLPTSNETSLSAQRGANLRDRPLTAMTGSRPALSNKIVTTTP